ncbi:hypothetical protein BWP03_06345 [Corynebacterium jeikeium]|nr:hypothetical protein BWP03_06345 [Corynebacterium jeikeium]
MAIKTEWKIWDIRLGASPPRRGYESNEGLQKRGMRCKKRRPVRATLYFLSRELAGSAVQLARELRVLSQTQSTDD